MAYDVFISYSTKDQEIVEKITAFLEQNQIRCWIAYRDIPVGRDWADFIPQAIEESQMMVYIHSSNSNSSKEIDKEIALSLGSKRPILPFKIENVGYLGSKAYHLTTINWIDAFPNPEKCFGRLLANVQKILKEVENGTHPGETGKNIKNQVDSEKENKAAKKIPNYLWYGLAGTVLLFFMVFGILKYSNSAKLKSDIKRYNELLYQADTNFSNGEDFYATALDHYKRALDYEQRYANSKHTGNFDSEIENRIKELETTIDSLVNEYESQAKGFDDCVEETGDKKICLQELIHDYDKLHKLQPDNQEIKTKLGNCKQALNQLK